MKFIYWIRSRRTMKYQYDLFMDVVNTRQVRLYIDCFGVKWMAQSQWEMRCKYVELKDQVLKQQMN